MKPNVTIRIKCPGSADVAAATYDGPTIHLIATVHEVDLQALSHPDFIDQYGIFLPRHIYQAFEAMIDSQDTNRIEIMQGITMYSCYRQPIEKPVQVEEDGEGPGYYEARALKLPRNYALTKEQRQELCFTTCRNRSICTRGVCSNDCPQVWPAKDPETDQGNDTDGTPLHPPCGNHCPTARVCVQAGCQSDGLKFNP